MKIEECSMRVDNELILFWNIRGEQYVLPKMLYQTFRQHILSCKDGKNQESNMPFLAGEQLGKFVEENADIVLKAIEDSLKTEAPESALSMPMTLNIQMDEGNKRINKETMMSFVKQAADYYIPNVVFKGSHILQNNDILDAVKYCSDNNTYSLVEMSDTKFDAAAMDNLIKAGVHMIKIPVDFTPGHSEMMSFAKHALTFLRDSQFNNYSLLWTATDNSVDEIEKVYALAVQSGAVGVQVNGFIPQDDDELDLVPSVEKFDKLYKFMRAHRRERVFITAGKCYSPLKAYLGKSFLLTNTNSGVSRGCGAGRDEVTLNVNGELQPCEDLNFPEDSDDIKEYWYTSKKLFQLRNIEKNTKMPCNNCEYRKYCVPCFAINNNVDGSIYKGGYNSCSICLND